MPRKRVRMIDVATAAGVSPTTASFVLNGRHASIPAETRQRVLTIAQELDYRPNAAAKALATGRTNRIGIVLNTPDSFTAKDAYFRLVLAGIVGSGPRFDYNLLLHTAHYKDWRALHADILSGTADGVLLVGRYESDELTCALLEDEFPTVCVSYHIDHPHCHWVDCENERAAYLAVDHLIAQGHTEIAFFYPGGTLSWGRERLVGAQAAIRDAGMAAEQLHLYTWSETELPSPEWCVSAIEFLKNQTPRPTAVVCCEEIRAQRFVEMLPAHGLTVPTDIALVSFNSTEISARTNPPMTSVWQPLYDIGATAMEMLVGLINGDALPQPYHHMPVRLDVRESSGVAYAVVAKEPLC